MPNLQPAEAIYCSKLGVRNGRGWSFPTPVAELIQEWVDGMSVLHLFGGKADFGLRLDIDPRVRPHVVGDAWLPPFGPGSFDAVVLDPPYKWCSGQTRGSLMWTSSYLARQLVVWFHYLYIEPGCKLKLRRTVFVVPSRSGAARVLQLFDRVPGHVKPMQRFTRGPAIRYNRWLVQPAGLPFGDSR